MGQVDPDDDEVDRWVVWHYRYDVARSERRNVVIATFDNVAEFEDRIEAERSRLSHRKSAGEAEATEEITGTHMPAGHQARMRMQRLRPRPRKARERKR